MSEVTKFYDDFSKEQFDRGINHRHLSIQNQLEKAGLEPNSDVLEVGCGIGTVTELMARFLSNKGSILAVDISEKNIQYASSRLSKYDNVICELKDLTQDCIDRKFNVIVLPDVIEHIPLDLHQDLFANLMKMLTEDGLIFIHIPHPNYLEVLVNKKDKRLQVIDQPIFTNKLCENIYPVGLYISQLTSYSLYTVDNDYQTIILRKKSKEINTDTKGYFLQLPLIKRLQNKLRYILRGNK